MVITGFRQAVLDSQSYLDKYVKLALTSGLSQATRVTRDREAGYVALQQRRPNFRPGG